MLVFCSLRDLMWSLFKNQHQAICRVLPSVGCAVALPNITASSSETQKHFIAGRTGFQNFSDNVFPMADKILVQQLLIQ